jgi:hypothetical protein
MMLILLLSDHVVCSLRSLALRADHLSFVVDGIVASLLLPPLLLEEEEVEEDGRMRYRVAPPHNNLAKVRSDPAGSRSLHVVPDRMGVR